MPDMLRENEIEFFIDTNGLLSAERGLLIGQEFLRYARLEPHVGPSADIEIVDLGRGSFRARLMIILRDPATATVAALASLAMSGVQSLREGTGSFPDEVAKACIESGAQRCGFRVHKDEFYVERTDMPGVARVEAYLRRTGGPLKPPPLGHHYVINEENAFVKAGDDFILARVGSDEAKPLAIAESVGHSDGTRFSDGSGYSQPKLNVPPQPKSQLSLEDWLARGSGFPWTAPAILYSVQELKNGPPRKRAVASAGNANAVIAMAMNRNYGPLDNLEVVIESGVLTLKGREIAKAAALPDRPGQQ